ncbi:YndJ family transporter [Actinoplanes sp. NPDC048988]|uniref:YndJ family transporter n=1 Tax=Actinoplanes sp. NPDC048988 TaxID=3363901 RepID=UPI003720A712
MWALVNALITLGMVLVVPAGLRLIGVEGPVAGSWPFAAAAGAASLWLPRGIPATGLAVLYAFAAVALALQALQPRFLTPAPAPAPASAATPAFAPAPTLGPAPAVIPSPALIPAPALGSAAALTSAPAPTPALARLPVWCWRRLSRGWREWIALATALAGPAVAAGALVAERAGYRLFGFELGVLTLTVAHFHFAGFAAALIAGLHRRLAPGRLADAAVLTVPAGTLLVLAGYFTSEFVELAGALVLTTGMWAMGWSTWRHARTRVPDRLTAALLATSALVLAASMVLAVSWALGEATDLPHPSLAWMAATHGVANALGFGLAAYTRLHTAALRTPAPTRD